MSLLDTHRSAIELKVSGTGWLCVKKPNNEWIAVFELTPQQTLEYIQALGILLAAVDPMTNKG